MAFRGSSGTMKIRLGSLNLASLFAIALRISSSFGGWAPGAGVRTATTPSPKSGCGRPTTADSPTPGNPLAASCRVRRDHAGFRHAVALEDFQPRPFFERLMGLREQRRRARDDEPHFAAMTAAERRLPEKPRVERRLPHHYGCLGQQAEDRLEVEPIEPDDARDVEEGCVERNEQPVHVEDR